MIDGAQCLSSLSAALNLDSRSQIATSHIFTDRVRSTRREVIFSLCLSVHTWGEGVPPPGPAREGDTPARSRQLGVPPAGMGYPTDGVLDTPRSVCPLRSRRRTFLVTCISCGFSFESSGNMCCAGRRRLVVEFGQKM